MHLESSGVHGFVSEVTVASFVAERAVHTWSSRVDGSVNGGFRIYPPTDSRQGFPGGAVAFRIIREESGPAGSATLPDSRFPVKLASFRPSRLATGVRFNAATGETTTSSRFDGMPPSVERTIAVDGVRYTAVAWIGPDAPPTLRTALATTISSLRF
jgi:hypothetical protein